MPSTPTSLKLIVMGTGPFAVPLLASLHESRHHVLALVTRPIVAAGKRCKSSLHPMRDYAVQHAIPVFDFEDVNAPQSVDRLRQLQADLIVVCDYGQILSEDVLATARLGGINLHGSLLPRYRGAAPVAWAIYHGETTTGVSVIQMTKTLDSGPIIASAELNIDPQETAGELEARLAKLGPSIVLTAIDRLIEWDGRSPIGQPQDASRATSARRLRKEDGLIRWDRSAVQLANQIRAFQPWPGSYTFRLGNEATPERLIILGAAALSEPADIDSNGPPGTVVRVEKGLLWIQTGSGVLSINRLQPAGKRPLTIAEYLRGYPIRSGERLVSFAIPKSP